MGNRTNVKMKHDIDSLHRIYHHGHRRRFVFHSLSRVHEIKKKEATANVRIYNIVMDSVCEWMQTDWIDHSIRFTSECVHRERANHKHSTASNGVWVACVCVCVFVDIICKWHHHQLSTWHYLLLAFYQMKTAGKPTHTIVMKFDFYLHQVTEVGNRQAFKWMSSAHRYCFWVVNQRPLQSNGTVDMA